MKLGKVELCHFLQLVGLFLCFSGTSQAEQPRSRSELYFQSGRSRTKRSWVWNQFFVLEEYMGSDPLYVGKVGHLAFQSSKWLLSISLIRWRVAHLYLVTKVQNVPLWVYDVSFITYCVRWDSEAIA